MGITSEYGYNLPEDLIAQYPAIEREGSRLLVLERKSRNISHRQFPDFISYLTPNDLIVLNNSRVIPARLRGVNARSGGAIESLLIEQNATNDWWVMLKPGKRARLGTQIEFFDRNGQKNQVYATVIGINDEGHRRLQFHNTPNILNELDKLGEPPLPPYIQRKADFVKDGERYQTVFAKIPGSVAAPTAGLHFSHQLLDKIKKSGIQIAYITLHVGPGTFAPVKVEKIEEHKMHYEHFEIPDETAQKIKETKARGGRILAVGTTSVRTLESIALKHQGKIVPVQSKTNLFIYPPYNFKVVDLLLTNFHLPCSTLLMLVSAFADPGGTNGKTLIFKAYNEAIKERYRFYSYGDTMLIL